VSSALRERQAPRVASIYRELVKAGEQHIVVLGDFNDFAGSPPLEPLLANTNLKDISLPPAFTKDGLDGTFGRASPKQRFDYLLPLPRPLRQGHRWPQIMLCQLKWVENR
jgi:endonuclease/exonuclease/phosphatase family metal-dependent hydrolase